MISVAPRAQPHDRPRERVVPRSERLLRALGADPEFVEVLLGDFAEEYSERAARDGVRSARVWYACEITRSAPHLLLSGIRYAYRHRRVPLAALAGVLLVPLLLVTTLLARGYSPAQLIAGASGAVVVNDVRPVRLPVRVLDAAGRLLRSADVKYEWMAGVPVSVSRDGVVTCREMGDATIRASLGRLSTSVSLYCRPVRNVWTSESLQLLVGDSAQKLPIGAMGLDSRPVTLLAGEVRSADSSIVALEGLRIRPVAPGFTVVSVRIGGHEATTEVNVYEPVHTLAGLRPEQRLVAAPVQLSSGQRIRWPLPKGLFWMRIGEASDGRPAPVLTLDGPVVCMPALGATIHQTHCLVREAGAFVTIVHPGAAPTAVNTMLSLEREEVP